MFKVNGEAVGARTLPNTQSHSIKKDTALLSVGHNGVQLVKSWQKYVVGACLSVYLLVYLSVFLLTLRTECYANNDTLAHALFFNAASYFCQ